MLHSISHSWHLSRILSSYFLFIIFCRNRNRNGIFSMFLTFRAYFCDTYSLPWPKTYIWCPFITNLVSRKVEKEIHIRKVVKSGERKVRNIGKILKCMVTLIMAIIREKTHSPVCIKRNSLNNISRLYRIHICRYEIIP